MHRIKSHILSTAQKFKVNRLLLSLRSESIRDYSKQTQSIAALPKHSNAQNQENRLGIQDISFRALPSDIYPPPSHDDGEDVDEDWADTGFGHEDFYCDMFPDDFKPMNVIKPDFKPTNVIKHCLLNVEQTGLFSCGGSVKDIPNLGLYIDNYGYLGLPLEGDQARSVISKCKMAPFGRKEETIIDPSVRHTWQLEPSQFSIKNPLWTLMIDSLVNHVCTKLGCNSKTVKHSLYKLLIYEPGSFFKLHRDSEKEQGMFATLIVVLPSIYSGGQLIVRHCDNVMEYDFGDIKSSLETNYASFYADCEHEIKPVTNGYRVCLVYNLLNTGSDTLSIVKTNSNTIQTVTKAVNDWLINADTSLGFLFYQLEHCYTDAGLSFGSLKGKDAAILHILKTVSDAVPLDIYLVNMEEKVRSKEYNTKYTRISKWVSDAGTTPFQGWNLPIRPENIVQEDNESLKDNNLNREESHDTGNEGTIYLSFYRYTGIIFWPRQAKYQKFLCEGGDSALTYLKTLKESEAREFSSLYIDKLKSPHNPFFSGMCIHKDHCVDLLNTLLRFDFKDLASELASLIGLKSKCPGSTKFDGQSD